MIVLAFIAGLLIGLFIGAFLMFAMVFRLAQDTTDDASPGMSYPHGGKLPDERDGTMTGAPKEL